MAKCSIIVSFHSALTNPAARALRLRQQRLPRRAAVSAAAQVPGRRRPRCVEFEASATSALERHVWNTRRTDELQGSCRKRDRGSRAPFHQIIAHATGLVLSIKTTTAVGLHDVRQAFIFGAAAQRVPGFLSIASKVLRVSRGSDCAGPPVALGWMVRGGNDEGVTRAPARRLLPLRDIDRQGRLLDEPQRGAGMASGIPERPGVACRKHADSCSTSGSAAGRRNDCAPGVKHEAAGAPSPDPPEIRIGG